MPDCADQRIELLHIDSATEVGMGYLDPLAGGYLPSTLLPYRMGYGLSLRSSPQYNRCSCNQSILHGHGTPQCFVCGMVGSKNLLGDECRQISGQQCFQLL